MAGHDGAARLHDAIRGVAQRTVPSHVWFDAGTINSDLSLTVDGAGTFPADGSPTAYWTLLPLGLDLASTDPATPSRHTLAQSAGTAHTHPVAWPSVFRPPQSGDRVAVAWARGASGGPGHPIVLGVLARAGTIVP